MPRAAMAAIELAGLGLVTIGAVALAWPWGLIAAGLCLVYITRGEA